MKFLKKTNNYIKTQIENNNLEYKKSGNNSKLKKLLLREQKNFCAYTEWYFEDTSSSEIEHFDNRKKGTNEDNYYNWYIVKRWSNAHKPDIRKYLPIMNPNNKAVSSKIKYSDNQFIIKDTNSSDYVKLNNLLKFIGCNKIEVATDRKNHIDKLKTIMKLYGTKEEMKNYLKRHKQDLSFITAIQHELDINLEDLI